MTKKRHKGNIFCRFFSDKWCILKDFLPAMKRILELDEENEETGVRTYVVGFVLVMYFDVTLTVHRRAMYCLSDTEMIWFPKLGDAKWENELRKAGLKSWRRLLIIIPLWLILHIVYTFHKMSRWADCLMKAMVLDVLRIYLFDKNETSPRIRGLVSLIGRSFTFRQHRAWRHWRKNQADV